MIKDLLRRIKKGVVHFYVLSKIDAKLRKHSIFIVLWYIGMLVMGAYMITIPKVSIVATVGTIGWLITPIFFFYNLGNGEIKEGPNDALENDDNI